MNEWHTPKLVEVKYWYKTWNLDILRTRNRNVWDINLMRIKQTVITTVLQTYIKKNSFQPLANRVMDKNGNLLAASHNILYWTCESVILPTQYTHGFSGVGQCETPTAGAGILDHNDFLSRWKFQSWKFINHLVQIEIQQKFFKQDGICFVERYVYELRISVLNKEKLPLLRRRQLFTCSEERL